MAKIEELKGFCYPLSPEGKCSLLGNPPWHYGTEYLNIAYRVDPDAVAKWLPEPVELGDHPDVAYVAFSKWWSVWDSDKDLAWKNPERTQYKEAAIWVGCSYKGEQAQMCLPIWVDNDFTMARGWAMGFPKKLGQVSITDYNPCNPTSTALSGKDLLALIDQLPKDVIVVVDEAYIDFADNSQEMTMVPHLADHPNMIVVQTYSKIYGLAAIRLGYALACPEIIRYLSKAMAARSLSTIAIEGGIAALEDEEFRRKTIENNSTEREYLTREFRAMGYKVCDSQANFIYADFGIPCGDLYFALLPYGVMIRGDFSMARISIGLHHQNETLVNAVKDLRAKGILH